MIDLPLAVNGGWLMVGAKADQVLVEGSGSERYVGTHKTLSSNVDVGDAKEVSFWRVDNKDEIGRLFRLDAGDEVQRETVRLDTIREGGFSELEGGGWVYLPVAGPTWYQEWCRAVFEEEPGSAVWHAGAHRLAVVALVGHDVTDATDSLDVLETLAVTIDMNCAGSGYERLIELGCEGGPLAKKIIKGTLVQHSETLTGEDTVKWRLAGHLLAEFSAPGALQQAVEVVMYGGGHML